MLSLNALKPIDYILGAGVLLTPALPSALLAILDLIVVRIAVIIALLYAISHGAITGLLTFALLGVLYLERNRRKIIIAQARFSQLADSAAPPPQMTVEEEGVSQKTVPVREFDVPEDRVMFYAPRTSCAANSNEFEPLPAGESLDTKVPLNTIPIGAQSAAMYQKSGFGRDSRNIL
jgi:hypothetical protein